MRRNLAFSAFESLPRPSAMLPVIEKEARRI